MVQGIGGNGSTGSIRDLSTYQVYYPMYQSYVRNRDSNLSFEAWLIKEGYIDNFTQKVENYVETGDATLSDGKDGNTLNSERYISNGTGAIFQTEDEDTFYEFDYDKGTYNKIQGTEEVAKALGLQGDKNVDTITFGYQKAHITDYTFGNLEDGQDSKNYSVGGKFAGVSYTNQEFDVHYILNALLMDPSDPQYNIAKEIFDKLCSNTKQWLPASDEQELDKIAAEFGANSAEYKAKLQEVLLKNLDQANEWVEEHTHVKNVNSGSLTENDGTEGTGGTEDGGDGTTKPGTVPDYDINSVLANCGLTADYNGNKTWSGPKHYDNKTCEQSSVDEARKYADEQLTNVMNAMIAEMGDKCTPEMKSYMLAAKAAVVGSNANSSGESNFGGWFNWVNIVGLAGKALATGSKGIEATASQINGVIGCETFGGGWFENWGAKGKVNVKKMVDEFTRVFNSLCVNNGKTDEEIAVEKKAAEEKKAKETTAFKNLFNTDMSSAAKEAGVGNNVQVVSPSSASEIQAKAETEILAPLKAKIKEKMAGQGISDSDLNTLLDNAAKAALSDCTEWATTSNNYVYTIDTDLLVSKFESNVKTIIKNKGYEF